jgi:hypothetical protein
LAVSAAPLFAQEHKSRVTHYDLEIIPDFTAKSIRIRTSMTIDNPALDKQFSFGLSGKYKVISAREGGAAVRFEQTGNNLELSLDKPLNHVRFEIVTTGTPGNSGDEDRAVIDDTSLFLLWSDRFYPTDLQDWATVTTRLTLPTRFKAVAPGKLIREKRTGNSIEHVFATTRPTVAYSVLADSEWIETKRRVAGIEITTELYPGSQKFAEQIFRTSGDVLQFFSKLHGGYFFDGFRFVTVHGMYARRAFCGFVGYEPGYLAKEMNSTGFDAHETSLLWWGYSTRGRGPGAFQWTEGFGDYDEVLYCEARHKPLAEILQYFRDQYLATPADQDVLYTALRGSTPQQFIHGKYPWLMQELRIEIGDAAFYRGMQLLFGTYKYRTFELNDLIGVFEKSSGRSLKTWRSQWLDRKGVPVIGYRFQVLQSAAEFRVHCHFEQLGQIYDLPLEIGIEDAAGTTTRRFRLADRMDDFDFDVPRRPSKIELDPHARILMVKKRLKTFPRNRAAQPR